MDSQNSIIIALIAIVIVAIIGLSLFTGTSSSSTTTSTGQAQSNNTVAIRLTDPPVVPSGTTSLTITYSSVGVQASGTQHSGWVYSNASGSVNLLSLLNLSQTIATVSIPNNASLQNVGFNVTSAEITINGTSYNVTIPSGKVTAHVEGVSRINGTGSILLSLSPTVAAVLTANSTIFVLVPSLRAVIVGTNETMLHVGQISKLNSSDKEGISRNALNVTITSAVLSAVGNSTSVGVTVKNSANQTVVINHLAIFGNVSTELNSTNILDRSSRLWGLLNTSVRSSSGCANITSNSMHPNPNDRPGLVADANLSANANVSVHMGNASANSTDHMQSNNSAAGNHMDLNATDFGDAAKNISSDYHMRFNSSVCTSSGLHDAQGELSSRMSNLSADFGKSQAHFKMVLFAVFQNGTMAVPSSLEDFNGSGYQLAAGQSATFNFTGQMAQGDGNLVVRLENGSAYRIVVRGEEGLSASANVTAT